ncbi:MAG TPA: hypothetical protein VMU05_15360 [Dongiaceae bacterium]|nr:hypothetical protein [Dongiaceae bacterium]
MTGALKLGSLGVTAFALMHFVTSAMHHMPGRTAMRTWIEPAEPQIVLVGPSVPAKVLFSLQGNGAARHLVVFRFASAGRSVQVRRSEQIAAQMEQARSAVSKQGVTYVVVADGTGTSSADTSLLISVRWNSRFKLLGTYPLPTGSGREVRNLYLFKNISQGSAEGFSPSMLAQR